MPSMALPLKGVRPSTLISHENHIDTGTANLPTFRTSKIFRKILLQALLMQDASDRLQAVRVDGSVWGMCFLQAHGGKTEVRHFYVS